MSLILSIEPEYANDSCTTWRKDWTHYHEIISSWEVVVNVLYCDIVECEYEIQSHYYVHFWNNTLRKGMNLLVSPANG